jgi:serine/threonine protein kinase
LLQNAQFAMIRVSANAPIGGPRVMRISQSRYEILGSLGAGATSRVFKARDTMIGRQVALKSFLRSFGSGDLQKRFQREAQIIGSLTHPNIVNLYDVGIDQDGVPYLVMEYVEGKTLETMLHAGRLPLERAALWGADLASALHRAHQLNIIHGDVKPANVLITAEGQVKLGDFGIARFDTQMSGSGSVLGTPAYLSPEQIQARKQDHRSDLFSLGIMLYEMTTGVRPFAGTSISAVCAQIVSAVPKPPSVHNPQLPPEFDHVVMRCLAKDPANRYSSAEALAAALYRLAHSKTSELAELSWWKRPLRKRDFCIAAGVLLALAFVTNGIRAEKHKSPAAGPLSAVVADPNAASRAASAPSATSAGDSSPATVEPATALIKISDTDIFASEQRLGIATPAVSSQVANQGIASAPSTKGSFDSHSTSPIKTAHVFDAHSQAGAKPRTVRSANGPTPLAVSLPAPSASSTQAATTNTPLPAESPKETLELAPLDVATKASLQINVVSNIGDQTLLVYAGNELLLTAPLQAAHAGETLHFACPIATGENKVRLALGRPGEHAVLEKSGTLDIRAGAPNTIGVQVTRRTRLLVKHEYALEVTWPGQPVPMSASAASTVSGSQALR